MVLKSRPVNARVPIDERVPGQQNESPGTVNVPGRIAIVINNSRLAYLLQRRPALSV